LNGRSLPTACAVGYKYFVAFTNSLTVNRDKRGSNGGVKLAMRRGL
jgi:hypothetical protein